MSDYLVPCIASFFLGVGITLIYVSLNFKEQPAEAVEAGKAPAPKVVGYDERGKDK